MGSILGPNRVIAKDVPTGAMSDARHQEYEKGKCLGPKQAQLYTMHNYDFQTNVVQSKGLLFTQVEVLVL